MNSWMRRAVAGLVAALLVATPVPAAAYPVDGPTGRAVTITGRVTDSAGQPVSGASVHAARTDVFSTTDSNGRYQLDGVPAGSAAVVAAKEGYAFSLVPRVGSAVDLRLAPQSSAVPRPEYPRPDSDRRPFTGDAWVNLNGTWSFDFDPDRKGEAENWASRDRRYSKAIQVPFPYQSLAAFGEQSLGTEDVHQSAFMTYEGDMWYRRTFKVPESFAGQRTRLRIQAAGWGARVYLNGAPRGSYLTRGDSELLVDLGVLAPGAEQTLAIRVNKPDAPEGDGEVQPQIHPFGRQDRFSRMGGLWQSVWLEPTGPGTLEQPRIVPEVTFPGTSRTPSAAQATVKVRGQGGSKVKVVIRDPDGTQVASGEVAGSSGETRLAIPSPRLWDLGKPNLYSADAILLDALGNQLDGIRTTFGLRRIERKVAPVKDADYQYVHLNNRPVFLRGVLDQGFNPWGGHTPTGVTAGPDLQTGTEANPGVGSILYDLKKVQEQGYNLWRTHVKLFEPLYYHWADKLGLLVWHELPNLRPAGGPDQGVPDLRATAE